MKKIFSIILIFILSIFIYGCSNFELQIIGPDIVYIDNPVTFVHNYNEDDNPEWNVSDSNLATIDKNGLLIPELCGELIISLKINDYYQKKKIIIKNDSYDITIEGVNNIEIGSKHKFKVVFPEGIEEDVEWSSLDESIATVTSRGYVEGINVGTTFIKAKIIGSVALFELNVTPVNAENIVISGVNRVSIGKTIQLNVTLLPENSMGEYLFNSSDENIAKVDENGIVKGINEGKVIITAYLKGKPNTLSKIEIEVVKNIPEEIKISGNNMIVQGKTSELKLEFNDNNVCEDVIWESSNPNIAIVFNGIVLGVSEGNAKIKAKSILDNNIYDEFTVYVSKYEHPEYSKEELDYVNDIISKMTLSQKIGQLFVVGFSGTSFTDSFKEVIKQYNFGNVIYMGANVTNYNTLAKMSNDIQKAMVEINSVPAFISTDQEGGRVARIKNGGTHFISSMAMAATNDYNNTYLEGVAMGKELKHYGINVDYAPSLDVNNNHDNPIIGVRSYSDNPVVVSMFGNNMIKGLKESGVMACVKHFPGHGNTNVDSHYGLPVISSSLEELYSIELAPFISSISNGIDSIMTTHIIFEAFDTKYPATLSDKVINGFLRNTLSYNGLVITDGMEMGAVTSNFGGYEQTAVQAIKAGVDILLYTSNTNPRKAHSALVNAVNNGDISIDRIEESIRRSLLKKLKYGILDNYLVDENKNISSLIAQNEKLNNTFAEKSVTLIKGNFEGLDKNKSTLIISPTTSNSLGEGLSVNSFGNYACNYLISNGFNKCLHYTISSTINSSEYNNIINLISEYDQIVFANSNETTNDENAIKVVKAIKNSNKTNLIIALDSPYDMLRYGIENVDNYVCVYGYQKASVIALSKYLNGEFKASAVSPIDINIYN